MAKVIGLSGDQAAAFAAKQCNVDVVAAYPITPQTIIVEEFSNYVANGEVETEFVCVESEHSAMSASIGASLTGARAFTATSSQGLALMHEMLYIASGLRCPIVLCNANRALSAPINIHCDHSDMMGSRDCGWIQIYAENAQEVYDWVIQSFRIAEDEDVQLPVSVNFDGFTITHSLEDMVVLDDAVVKKFVGVRKPRWTLEPQRPVAFGSLVLPDYYYEFKVQASSALKHSLDVIRKVNAEYARISGREYATLEARGLDKAKVAVICLGSTVGTAKVIAKKLGKEGIDVGVIKPWVYRPFPEEELLDALTEIETITVLDRAISPGASYGPLACDVVSALYRSNRNIGLNNLIYGLGGRDLSPQEMEAIMRKAAKDMESKRRDKAVTYIGVRE
ncbi:MAG: transketolase C-terminal domain-containing protein [Candidatus Bathyarchaeia archaeon]